MKVVLHTGQLEVAKDKHRYRVICAGRRWGKSVLAQLVVLQWAIKEPGNYWIVSPTYRQGKQIHWRGLQEVIPSLWIAKKNEVELSITLKNGSIIELKGAENPDNLRGIKLRGLVIDEIASIKNWGWLWDEVLRATLTDYSSPALFISTPKGYNHFHELYQQGQFGTDDYKSWRFTSYDNPYIKKEEIDFAKKDLSENVFHQEYMADFRKYTGTIYKEFNKQIHVVEPFDIPDNYHFYGGIDFGSTNPTAHLTIAVDPDDNWIICSEHYASNQTIDFHAGIINSRAYTPRIEATYGDPSGTQWISEFATRSIYITPANKEGGQSPQGWVRFGIEKVQEKLKIITGHKVSSIPRRTNAPENANPSLFIFSTCFNLIHEFETYRWKEKNVSQAQDLNEPDMPEKANDHLLDALRYFAVSYKKPFKIPYNFNDFTKWRI